MKYIALLRGINVGGHVVKMERLRELFTEMGFQEVRTFIQTGNVFFEASGSRKELQEKIEKHLFEALGYEVPTFLRTISELEKVIEDSVFKGQIPESLVRFMIVFCNELVHSNVALPLISEKGDCKIVGITPSELHVYMEVDKARLADPNTLIQQVVGKAKVTTRFYHTTKKILEAAKS